MVDDLVNKLLSKEYEIVQQALLESALFFEKETDDIGVDRLLHAVSDVCFEGDSKLQSAALWAIGKVRKPTGIKVLRNVFEVTLQSCNSFVVWQWLIAYDNLIGKVVLDEDVYIFNLIGKAFEDDSKVYPYVQKFIFHA